MVAAECYFPEPSAPPAVTQALCVECKEAAVQRCEECFDEEEGHLYLCAKDACFDSVHPERQRRKHRKSLVAWNSPATRDDECCATHLSNVLELWCVDCSTLVCALCCSHGAHAGHKRSLVSDAAKGMQAQLQATMDQLEDENVKSSERLWQLKEEEDGLASGNGAVGDARRALQEVKALFLAKVDALDGELDATAARWSAQVAAEHEQLARHAVSVRAIVDDMRATCAEEKAERVVIAHPVLYAERDALGSAPPASVRKLEFDAAPLRQAVADLCAQTIEGMVTVCTACGGVVPEDAAQCDDCAEAVRAFEKGGGNLQTAGDSLRANKAVVLAAVAKDGRVLRYANEELKSDKETILAAVAQNGDAFQYANKELRSDKSFILAAISLKGEALQHADEVLRADKNFILTTVALNGCCLFYGHEKFTADEETILAAVAQNGEALLAAKPHCRGDKTFILTCVARNGLAYPYAHKDCRADKEIVVAAVAQNPELLHRGWVGEKFSNDKDVRRAAGL